MRYLGIHAVLKSRGFAVVAIVVGVVAAGVWVIQAIFPEPYFPAEEGTIPVPHAHAPPGPIRGGGAPSRR